MANLLKPTGVNNIWSINGTKTDPGLAKANTGWVVELPPYQTANWIEYRQDSFIAHSNQHGIPEWDSVTEYQGNISYTKGSNGIVYKCLQTNINTDPANPLNTASWTQAFETYGSVAVVTASLNDHLTNYSTLAGIANTAAARTSLSVYSKAESDARFANIVGSSGQVFSVANATEASHAVPLGQINSLLSQATEATVGVAKIATNGVVATGTNDTDIVTPLKLATSYLSKAGNLAGLGDVAVARANLGLGTLATLSDALFLRAANNLSDLADKPTARSNLGLTSTAIQAETYFLRSGLALADLVNKPAARTNLGLTMLAVTQPSAVLFKSDNLTGLANTATARANLGLGSSATLPSDTWLNRGSNLGDLTNVQAARNNLGLGSASTMNTYGVGAMDFRHGGDNPNGGWAFLGSNLTLQWGIGPAIRYDQSVVVGLHMPGNIMNVQITGYGTFNNQKGPSWLVDSLTGSTFRVSENDSEYANQFFWQALVFV